jgi:hypothetical protein
MLGPAIDAAQAEGTAEGGRDGAGSPNEDRRPRSRIDAAAAKDGAAEVLRQSRDELVRAVAGVDPAASS